MSDLPNPPIVDPIQSPDDANKYSFNFGMGFSGAPFTIEFDFYATKMVYAHRIYIFEDFLGSGNSPSGLGGALFVVDNAAWRLVEIVPLGVPYEGMHHMRVTLTASARNWTGYSGVITDYPLWASPVQARCVVEFEIGP